MSLVNGMIRIIALAAGIAVVTKAPVPARAGDAPRAIDAIENDLVADDPSVRAKAAAELTDRFPDGAVAVPMLVDLLDDESPDVVAAAAKAIDSLSLAGLTLLTSWCTDDSHLAATTLFNERISVALTDRSPTALRAFTFEEQQTGTAHSDSLALAALLPQQPSSLSSWSALPLLSRFFRGASGEARALAAAALAIQASDVSAERGVAPAPPPARAAIGSAAVVLLKSDSDLRAWIGARLIARTRRVDASTVVAVVGTMSASKKSTRYGDDEIRVAKAEACRTLVSLGPAAAAAAPALLDVAGRTPQPGGPEIWDCVRALRRMGKEGDLVALLARKPPTAVALAAALARDGCASAIVASVLRAAAETDPYAIGVLDGLKALGPSATATVPILLKRCRAADNPWDRLSLIDTVLAIAPDNSEGLTFLEAAIADEETNRGGLWTLATRTVSNQRLAERLGNDVAMAAKSEPGNFMPLLPSIDGLARCGAMAKAFVPDVVQALAIENKRCAEAGLHPYEENRNRIAVALGRIGPDAAAAIPALTALRDKGDETIRVAAAQALRRIRAKK